MVEPRWMQVRDLPGAAEKKAIFQEALISGCWIYSTVSKKWYTPEEFMASPETVRKHRDTNDSKKFVVKHPNVGKQQRIDYLKRASEELDVFCKRIDNYYDLKRKTK